MPTKDADAQESGSAREYPAPIVAWSAVAVLFVLGAVAFLDRQIISLMVDPIRADLGVNDFEISLLQGFAFAFCYALMGLPLGWIVDRYSRRIVIFCGVIVWATAASACGLARNFYELLFARFGVGLGEAALQPAAYSMMSDYFSRERLTTAMSVFAMGSIFGQAIAFLAGGLIIDLAVNAAGDISLPVLGEVRPWQFVFLVTGIPGLVAAFLIFLVPEPARIGRRSTDNSTYRGAFAFMARHKAFFACHFLGYGAIAAIAFGTIAWVPAYMMRVFGWTPVDVGMTLALMSVVIGAAGLLLMALFVDWMVQKGSRDAHFRFGVWLACLVAVSGVLAFTTSDIVAFFVLYSVMKFLAPVGGMASASIQLVTPGAQRGKVSAIYLFVVTLLGAGSGPMIVAAITEHVLGDRMLVGQAMAIAIGVLAPFAALCFMIGRKHMRAAIEEIENAA